MPYSKRFWYNVGAVVLAVVVLAGFLLLRREKVQRASLFSTPEEVAEATDEPGLPFTISLPTATPAVASMATPSPVPVEPSPTPTLTREEQELLDADQREALERKIEEQRQQQERIERMRRQYVALAAEQSGQFKSGFARLRQLSQGKPSSKEVQGFLKEYQRTLKSFEAKRDSIKDFGSKDAVEEIDNRTGEIRSRLDVLMARVGRGDAEIPAEVVEEIGVSRARAYEVRAEILESLPSLVRPVGRPPRASSAPPTDRSAELSRDVLEFLFAHPGAAHRGPQRQR